jgi:Ino eighty subunit 1
MDAKTMEPEPPRDAHVDRKPKTDPDQKDSQADADKMDPDQTDSGPATTTAGKDEEPHYTSTTTTTRRNANGSVSSVYSGNKIRHLKKEDGVPLWRKDIQYDFLKAVFDNDLKVFTKASDGSKGYTFADVYLDAMAKSSKTSKILKDKLLTDKPAAINMAMVCLLVNVGRMNTTLNCSFTINLAAPTDVLSLPRNASPASDVPFHPLPAGPPGPQCLQAAAGCPSPKVHPQGRHRGHRAAQHH